MSDALRNRIPDFQTLMFPVMEFLKDNEAHSLQEVLQHLIKKFELTEDELRITVPSGQQPLFKNRVTWSISYLKNAGLINYVKKGIYQITEMGQTVFTDNINSITTNYLKKFAGYELWQKSFLQQEESDKIIGDTNEIKTPEELIVDNFKKINNKLSLELLEIIKEKTPAQFERYVLELLSKMGYGAMEEGGFEVVGQSGDNGIDGIIYQDKLGIERVYVQAKKWKDNKVQSKDIRDFIGALSLKGTNKGIFITTSNFTEDAKASMKMNPHNRVILINGQQLAEFSIEHNVGVQTKKVYEVKDIDNDFFDEL